MWVKFTSDSGQSHTGVSDELAPGGDGDTIY